MSGRGLWAWPESRFSRNGSVGRLFVHVAFPLFVGRYGSLVRVFLILAFLLVRFVGSGVVGS